MVIILNSDDNEFVSLHEFYLSPEDWMKLSCICDFLSPLELLSNMFCKDGNAYPTSPLIVLMFSNLYDYFDVIIDSDAKVKDLSSSVVVEAAQEAHEKLKNYYSNSTPAVMLCLVFDPCYKLSTTPRMGFLSAKSVQFMSCMNFFSILTADRS